MIYNNLGEILADCENLAAKKHLAVICADDRHTLEAVDIANSKNIIVPILIGDKNKIHKFFSDYPGLRNCDIRHAPNDELAVNIGIELVKEKKADALMKGHIETAPLLRAIVNKQNNICKAGVLNHLTIMSIPNYPKLLGITDVALLTYPNFEQKKQAIINSVEYMSGFVSGAVKTAVLASVEVVNTKMPETVDARQLQEFFEGDKRCIVEGPLSYDLAMDLEASVEKGFLTKIGGRADLLVVPNITVGNVLAKALYFSANAQSVGLILGANVPIVLVSRSSSALTKYQSIVMAVS